MDKKPFRTTKGNNSNKIDSIIETRKIIFNWPLAFTFFVKSICLAYINMFAKFDEIPALTLQDIKETKHKPLYKKALRTTKGNNSNKIGP